MFDTVCTFPLQSDLFAQAVHPNEPIVSVGLSSGHVQTFRLPSTPVDSDADGASRTSSTNGTGHIDTIWSTRRHRGSCRCLSFGIGGETLYSAGTDGIVKAAKVETGAVENKIVIPPAKSSSGPEWDAPSVIHALSPQNLLLATDSGALHIYDLRIPYSAVSARPEQTYRPHDDYISSLIPLPPSSTSTSGFSKQWVTTGGTTLAVTDLRKGIIARSEDQEEELISSVYIGGLPSSGTSVGEKIIVGGGSGVLTLWEKGVWDDQDERIYVARGGPGGGEALESLTVMPDELGKGKMIAVGQSDGRIAFVQIGSNKVVSRISHDEAEGVVALSFDVEGRMVSGGGQVVKVWHEAEDGEAGKHLMSDSDEDQKSDDGDDGDGDDSDEDQGARKRRKKRKRVKGKDRNGGRQVMAFDLD